jgi:peptidoglycan/LPS O-acetylase OafA/YrhL
MSERKINRIVPLDWLRGLCAISIMLYHFFFIGKNDMLFGKLGVYAVSAFFIISGLSMAIVYNNYIKGLKDSIVFFSKRLFRIIPIYAIACILTILLLPDYNYSFIKIVLNITTLFGFVHPADYIPVGGWSIGNEMVFYLFTPVILFIYDKKTLYGNLILVITTVIGLYFAFFLLDPNDSLANQWKIYTNPLNNLFLFVLGIAIFYNFNKITINKLSNIVVLFGSFILFILYPFDSHIEIVTGRGRIIFVIIVAVWVFSFFKMKIDNVSTTGKVFEMFGMATYGVYILHPIIRMILSGANKFLNTGFPSIAISIIAVFITIVAAIISYYYFELKISNWGKNLIKKVIN